MELDPTPLLSVIVPVLFGLMFPDLGHGLVLAALSLVMAPRHPGCVSCCPADSRPPVLAPCSARPSVPLRCRRCGSVRSSIRCSRCSHRSQSAC